MDLVVLLYFDIHRQAMMKRPQSALGGGKRPVSQYARLAAAVDMTNPRFRSENILLVELDMPARTTRDYEGPVVAPKVRNIGSGNALKMSAPQCCIDMSRAQF